MLYKRLREGVVPIVLGGGDYTKFGPPNSFINVNNFASSKELAELVGTLSRNSTAYSEYLSWRKQGYRVHNANLWCALCEKLNQENGERKSYLDLKG